MVPTRTISTQFPDWTLEACRAYRDGVRAAQRETVIREGFTYESEDELDDLTVFFLRGYADSVGPSAEGEHWFDEIGDWRIAHEWWADSSDDSGLD